MKYCHRCGMQLKDDEEFCPNCGAKRKPEEDSKATTSSVDVIDFDTDTNVSKKSKTIALLLWFFLGGLGIHNFYIGDNNRAVKELICTLLLFLIVPAIILLVLWLQDLIKLLTDKCLDEDGMVVSSWKIN